MDQNTDSSVFSILRSRESVFELLIAAIILAFGINLLSDAFGLVYPNTTISVVVGSLCILLPIAYWVRKFINASKFELELEALLPIESKTGLLFEIDRYYYSEECSSILSSVFKENPALKSQWIAEIFPSRIRSKRTVDESKERSGDLRIAQELTEYVVLHALSVHLTDYFNALGGERSGGIVNYRRTDLAEIVLGNRILDLISKHPADRPALGHDEELSDGHELVMMGKNGLIFSKFELTLPRGSTVHRTIGNAVLIQNSRFKLQISVSGGESSGVPPRYFSELHMGRKYLDFEFRKIDICIRGELTWSGMLGIGKWDYFTWMDSFLSKLKSRIDFEQFVKQIGYELSLTTHQLDRFSISKKRVRISRSK